MEKKQHPSYGMIRFARSSIGGSGTALFGSSIMHNNVIRLSISKGMMEREGNEDWFLAGTDINDMIVEVEMSYTQFAEAITSLNIGEGIPVTITKVNGTFVEPCPYSDRQKVMRREVDEATRDLVRQLEKRSEEIEKLLDEKRVLSREDRRNIVSTLKNVRQELKSNIPYLQKLFAEQMDKTVTDSSVLQVHRSATESEQHRKPFPGDVHVCISVLCDIIPDAHPGSSRISPYLLLMNMQHQQD